MLLIIHGCFVGHFENRHSSYYYIPQLTFQFENFAPILTHLNKWGGECTKKNGGKFQNGVRFSNLKCNKY